MRLWICRILLAGFCLGVLAFFACTHQDGGDAQPLLLFRKGDDSWHSPYCAVDELLRPRTKTDARECTAEELLPTPEEDLRYRWVPLGGHEARGRQYDCSCPYTKATYFCSNGRTDYPLWVPKAVADGVCSSVSGNVLDNHPFPPGASLLFYGNSHLRQVVEGIMCLYADKVVRRKVQFLNMFSRFRTEASLLPETQCRGCLRGHSDTLVDHSCLAKKDAYRAVRCCDDRGEYELCDGVTVHYHFANNDNNKSVEQALEDFDTSFADYDFIIANAGNTPRMHTDRAVRAAQLSHDAGASFIWLTTYNGIGDVGKWTAEDRQAFAAANVTYIPVHDMMESMINFTTGVAKGTQNTHFCLPGPPDELGVFLLELIWALYSERSNTRGNI